MNGSMITLAETEDLEEMGPGQNTWEGWSGRAGKFLQCIYKYWRVRQTQVRGIGDLSNVRTLEAGSHQKGLMMKWHKDLWVTQMNDISGYDVWSGFVGRFASWWEGALGWWYWKQRRKISAVRAVYWQSPRASAGERDFQVGSRWE